jgi:hypothetical protein
MIVETASTSHLLYLYGQATHHYLRRTEALRIIFIALMMEEAEKSQTSINFYHTTQRKTTAVIFAISG